jgi:hypothetical protein
MAECGVKCGAPHFPYVMVADPDSGNSSPALITLLIWGWLMARWEGSSQREGVDESTLESSRLLPRVSKRRRVHDVRVPSRPA